MYSLRIKREIFAGRVYSLAYNSSGTGFQFLYWFYYNKSHRVPKELILKWILKTNSTSRSIRWEEDRCDVMLPGSCFSALIRLYEPLYTWEWCGGKTENLQCVSKVKFNILVRRSSVNFAISKSPEWHWMKSTTYTVCYRLLCLYHGVSFSQFLYWIYYKKSYPSEYR